MNTKAKGVHHRFGGDFSDIRNGKSENVQRVKGTMFGPKKRGLDYSPLFRFLLSKIRHRWDEVFSEATSRLDRPDPIFWMVALNELEKKYYVRIGESTNYSGYYVDDKGILRVVNPDLKAVDMTPFCECCTHTFNGKVFGNK